MENLKWFIRRPHAIDQFKTRAGFPDNTDSVELESALRQALNKAAEDPVKNFLQGCKDGQVAVRIAIPKRNTVYAILKPPSNGHKTYDYVVPTVLDTRMYSAWNVDGKLGTIADLTSEKRDLPKLKPVLHMRWSNGDGKEHAGDYCVDDVTMQIQKLLNNGIKREDIKVYKEIAFTIDVSLPLGITS